MRLRRLKGGLAIALSGALLAAPGTGVPAAAAQLRAVAGVRGVRAPVPRVGSLRPPAPRALGSGVRAAAPAARARPAPAPLSAPAARANLLARPTIRLPLPDADAPTSWPERARRDRIQERLREAAGLERRAPEPALGRLSGPSGAGRSLPRPLPRPSARSQAEPPRTGLIAKASLGLAPGAFIAAVALQSVGIETQFSAFPEFVKGQFNDFSLYAELNILARVTAFAGRMLAPRLISKLGFSKVMWIGNAVRAAAVTGILLWAVLSPPTFSFAAMAALHMVDGFGYGLAYTADQSAASGFFGKDNTRELDRYEANQLIATKAVATAVPILAGLAAAAFGVVPLVIAIPAALALSALAAALFVRTPPGPGPAARAAPAPKDVRSGWTIVMSNPLLRTILISFIALWLMNPVLYGMMAPAFSELLSGGLNAGPGIPTLITGLLIGLFNLGALIGGLIIRREVGRKDSGSGPEADESHLRSTLRWMSLAALGVLAFASFALPLPGWAALALPGLLLIPTGLAQGIALIKLKNLFLRHSPKGGEVKAIGFLFASCLAAIFAIMVGLKFMFSGKIAFIGAAIGGFSGLPGLLPFVAVALAMIPAAILLRRLRLSLEKLAAGAPPPPAAQDQGPRRP